MKKMIQICFVVFLLSTMTACGNKDLETSEQKETATVEPSETINEEEPAIASKSPLVRENSTTIASADLEEGAKIDNITGNDAIQLLSQIDVKTLELDSAFEDYHFVCGNECTDIDGIEVYRIEAYLVEEKNTNGKDDENNDSIDNEIQEADNVYFVTLDGNAMFKLDYSGENYINLETGEEIEIIQESNS